MWRDPSGLFPGVGVDRSGALFSSSRTVPMGVDQSPLLDAPADAPMPLGASATPLSECAAYGCTDPPAGDWTGRCAPHGEAFRDRAHELTGAIGRGEMDA